MRTTRRTSGIRTSGSATRWPSSTPSAPTSGADGLAGPQLARHACGRRSSVRLAAAFLLLFALACRRPEAAPAANVAGPKLVVHFLDKDAALPLGGIAPGGHWAFMNMGAWDPLE